jgi:hypothetical protein
MTWWQLPSELILPPVGKIGRAQAVPIPAPGHEQLTTRRHDRPSGALGLPIRFDDLEEETVRYRDQVPGLAGSTLGPHNGIPGCGIRTPEIQRAVRDCNESVTGQ